MRDALLVVMVGALLALTWPSALQEAAGTPIATKHCPKECVVFVSRPIPQSKLQKYEKSTCGKAAVILTTKKNLVFCAKPEDNWVQLAMRKLDEKNAPPSPTVESSIFEKRVMFHNISGTAVPTSAQAEGPARPTETGAPERYRITVFPIMRTGVSSRSAGSSAGSAEPQPEVVAATHQPETLANGSLVSSVIDGPKTLGDDLTPVGKGLEEFTGSSANYSGAYAAVPETPSQFDSEDPMGSASQSTSRPSFISLSSPLTDSERSGTKSTTASPDLLRLSDLQGSILSQPNTDPGPSSTVGPTILPQRRDVTGRSSTLFGSDGSKTSSFNMTGRKGVVDHSTVAFGDASRTPSLMQVPKSSGTLPTSHQESVIEEIKAAETTSHTPEILVTSLPAILSAYRTHIITCAALGGIVCISVVAWAYMKWLGPTSLSNEMVQGLLFSPSKYQISAGTVDIL